MSEVTVQLLRGLNSGVGVVVFERRPGNKRISLALEVEISQE